MNGPMDQMNGPMNGPMDQMDEWTLKGIIPFESILSSASTGQPRFNVYCVQLVQPASPRETFPFLPYKVRRENDQGESVFSLSSCIAAVCIPLRTILRVAKEKTTVRVAVAVH